MKRTVTTYSEGKKWVDGFAQGKFGVLIVVGEPGVGKSRMVKEATLDHARLIEGRTTVFELYCEFYRHFDETFVIDDVDQLYTDKDAVRLLKCVCQTEAIKTVAWHTSSPKLDAEDIPREFEIEGLHHRERLESA